MNNDPFILLGLSKDASFNEVKKRYRELARIYHPDINPNTDADAKMSILNDSFGRIERGEFVVSEPPAGDGAETPFSDYINREDTLYEQELRKMRALFSTMSDGFKEMLIDLSTMISFIFYAGYFMPTMIKNLGEIGRASCRGRG